MPISFRKAVAQAYCLHKHIVNEYHHEQHVWGAELAQSALEKKGEGLIVLFPAAIRSALAGHAPRSAGISRFRSRFC